MEGSIATMESYESVKEGSTSAMEGYGVVVVDCSTSAMKGYGAVGQEGSTANMRVMEQ